MSLRGMWLWLNAFCFNNKLPGGLPNFKISTNRDFEAENPKMQGWIFYGDYHARTNTIRFNRAQARTPYSILATMGHECIHMHQRYVDSLRGLDWLDPNTSDQLSHGTFFQEEAARLGSMLGLAPGWWK